jgi:hypothetical protein
VSARRPGGAAAGTPAKRRPRATVNLVAAGHGQPPHHRFPSGPIQAGDHPPADTGGTSTHCAQPTAPHPATPGPARRGPRGGSAADSAGLSVRTPEHRTPGHRTPGHRTPDTGRWTSARPAGRTSHGGTGARTGQRPAWPASGHPRAGDPAGRPDLARVTRLGALGHPGRPRGGGTCAGALTAAATDSCLAPPGMRPRPGALLSCVGVGGYEGRAMGLRKVRCAGSGW